MIFCKRIPAFVTVFLLIAIMAKAQDKPIGYWESHLPYNTALGVATDGNTVYTICNQAFFTYNPSKNQMEPYSKVEGMSDIGMQCIGFDMATSTAILIYSDGNIDLFKDNTFYNIPDLKIKTVSGNKSVNEVYTENGIAYLSTSLGIILVDMDTHNINETYQFIKNNTVIPVNSFIGSGNYFYAVTGNGLYQANKNNPELQNFSVWQNVDSTDTFLNTASVNGVLFLSTQKKIYSFINDTFKLVYTSDSAIRSINAGLNTLLIGELVPPYGGRIKIMDSNYHIIDSFSTLGFTSQSVQLLDSSIWVAAPSFGLEKRTGVNLTGQFIPIGPSDPNSYDLYAYNKNLWIAHGTYSDLFISGNSGADLSNLSNDKWMDYYQYGYQPFDTMKNFVSVVKDQVDGTVYGGSFEDGLFILKEDGTFQILKQNSIFDTSLSEFGQGQRQIIGLALDNQENLWVSLLHSAHQLYVKTKDSNWYAFQIPNVSYGGNITIDNNNQVWFVSSTGNGAIVYNTNGTISDPTDDAYYHLTTGVGYGNLPSNNVLCMACDKNNNIWIGTDNGIGIVSGCAGPFTQQSPPCDAEIPIVQYDQFAGYLFAGNNVRSIAVDGANRKWVGTDNGIWLLSSDASKIINNFTADNSPLPSNSIQKITIDKITGDVYIGTDEGLVTYHGTAVDGGTTNQNVQVYPDPVPSGFSGTIAIKGLVANADVRITDIDGQLVYRTTALGGQAVWNGMDYKGHRPQSGVYLIFVSSSDGTQTYTGKIVFIQ